MNNEHDHQFAIAIIRSFQDLSEMTQEQIHEVTLWLMDKYPFGGKDDMKYTPKVSLKQLFELSENGHLDDNAEYQKILTTQLANASVLAQIDDRDGNGQSMDCLYTWDQTDNRFLNLSNGQPTQLIVDVKDYYQDDSDGLMDQSEQIINVTSKKRNGIRENRGDLAVPEKKQRNTTSKKTSGKAATKETQGKFGKASTKKRADKGTGLDVVNSTKKRLNTTVIKAREKPVTKRSAAKTKEEVLSGTEDSTDESDEVKELQCKAACCKIDEMPRIESKIHWVCCERCHTWYHTFCKLGYTGPCRKRGAYFCCFKSELVDKEGEDNAYTCDADPCNIGKIHGNTKKINWVQCRKCEKWHHTFCKFGHNEKYRGSGDYLCCLKDEPTSRFD